MIARAGAARRGALLIVVVGLVSVVMAIALAFLARMRADGEEGIRFGQDIQARVMLTSALMYVQETARIGWGDETYGWRDVRDGMVGPRAFGGDWTPALQNIMGPHATAPCFPAVGAAAARCPMYRMRRPPWAIKTNVAPNPVPFSDPNDTAQLSLPWSQIVNFTHPDPAPDVAHPNDPVLGYQEFKNGDPQPIDNDSAPAWFRVYRKTPLRFVVTCGAGASRGWKTYDDAVAAGEDAWGSRAAFDEVRRNEAIVWYEAEWSDIVSANYFLLLNYARWHFRSYGQVKWTDGDEQPNMRQQTGTFTYIERLPDYPPDW